MGRTRHTIITIAALSTLGLAACGADTDDAADAPAEESSVDSADFGVLETAESPADDAAPPENRTGSVTATGLEIQDFGRDIIREVGLTMTTDDVARTVADVRRLTRQNGGAVFSSDVSVEPALDDGTVPGDGTLTIRIPPQDLDRLVIALDGLGGLSRLTQDSEDVTEQLVDLEIRIRQAETGIERIEEILEQTTDLDDLFSVENELTRRQVELERLLASQRATEDRVALATLTVRVVYDVLAPVTTTPVDDDPGIGDAFSDGWNAFLGALFAVGFVLAITAPFLAAAAIVLGVIWLVTRRLRRVDSGEATADAETTTDVSDHVDEPSQTA